MKAFINKGPVTKPDFVKIIFPETAKFVGAKVSAKSDKDRNFYFQNKIISSKVICKLLYNRKMMTSVISIISLSRELFIKKNLETK